MSDVKDRVKMIRESVDMTMEEFGNVLGVKKQTISKLENGVNNLTEQMIKGICREFNVNYDFLVYGTGEMFDKIPETVIEEICIQYKCDEIDKKLVLEYLKLSPENRNVIKEYIKNVFLD